MDRERPGGEVAVTLIKNKLLAVLSDQPQRSFEATKGKKGLIYYDSQDQMLHFREGKNSIVVTPEAESKIFLSPTVAQEVEAAHRALQESREEELNRSRSRFGAGRGEAREVDQKARFRSALKSSLLSAKQEKYYGTQFLFFNIGSNKRGEIQGMLSEAGFASKLYYGKSVMWMGSVHAEGGEMTKVLYDVLRALNFTAELDLLKKQDAHNIGPYRLVFVAQGVVIMNKGQAENMDTK